jgi:hypothetical protein
MVSARADSDSGVLRQGTKVLDLHSFALSRSRTLINNKKNSISIFYSQIAYVSQNIYLADDSIYSNITFSDNQNDKKRVEKILEIF